MAEFDIAPPTPPKFFNKTKEKKIVSKKEESAKSDVKESKKESKNNLKKDVPVEEVPVEPKKTSFFSLFSRKKKDSEDVKEEELDLEKIREQFKIAPPKNKLKDDKLKNVKWTEDDSDEKTHLKDDEIRWDVEDPLHLKKPILVPIPKNKDFKSSKTPKKNVLKKVKSSKKTKVSKVKNSKLSAKKVKTAKKSVKVSVKKVTIVPPKKKVKISVDKAILAYFNKIETEQGRIKKELELMVANPKRSLHKKTHNYLIHHNEKMIKSMKHLIVAIKSIEDIKFKKSVRADKKKFEKWIQGILDLEKKAEIQRNNILQKKMAELFAAYSKGLYNDLYDKRYELSNEKKAADEIYKRSEKYELRLKKYHEKLKAMKDELEDKKKHINDLIAQGIQKKLAKKFKKERASLASEEAKYKKLMDEYDSKLAKFHEDVQSFKNKKKESAELIEQGDSLRRLKNRLENKELKLKEELKNIHLRDKELKSQVKELQGREAEIDRKDKYLKSEAKRLANRENELEEKEREIKLELRDFDIRKKDFELRKKEINDMETYFSEDTKKFENLKQEATIKDKKATHKWQEAMNLSKVMEKEIKSEEKVESKLKGLVDEFTVESKKLKKDKKESKELIKKGSSLKKLKNELDNKSSKLSKLDAELLQREQEANNKLHETKELIDDIQKKELDIMNSKKDVDVNFTHFLRDNFDDIPKPSHPNELVENFNEKIVQCRDMLDTNEFEEAKKMYSELRSDFFNAKFEPGDRETVYNSLRELYDDIYLGMISLN